MKWLLLFLCGPIYASCLPEDLPRQASGHQPPHTWVIQGLPAVCTPQGWQVYASYDEGLTYHWVLIANLPPIPEAPTLTIQ